VPRRQVEAEHEGSEVQGRRGGPCLEVRNTMYPSCCTVRRSWKTSLCRTCTRSCPRTCCRTSPATDPSCPTWRAHHQDTRHTHQNTRRAGRHRRILPHLEYNTGVSPGAQDRGGIQRTRTRAPPGTQRGGLTLRTSIRAHLEHKEEGPTWSTRTRAEFSSASFGAGMVWWTDVAPGRHTKRRWGISAARQGCARPRGCSWRPLST